MKSSLLTLLLFISYLSGFGQSSDLIPFCAEKFCPKEGRENVSVTSAPCAGNLFIAVSKEESPPLAPGEVDKSKIFFPSNIFSL